MFQLYFITVFTGGSLGSNLSVNNVGGPCRRPPSHQELVAHTQSIMQKALLKQELEKAKEVSIYFFIVYHYRKEIPPVAPVQGLALCHVTPRVTHPFPNIYIGMLNLEIYYFGAMKLLFFSFHFRNTVREKLKEPDLQTPMDLLTQCQVLIQDLFLQV